MTIDQETPRRGSPLPAVLAGLFAVALVGAGVYIAQLRTELASARTEAEGLREQLAPFTTAAASLYPDAEPATALRSVGERLETLLRARQTAATARQQAPAAAAEPVEPADILNASQEEAMVAILRNEIDTGRKAWFLVAQNNREAQAIQAELQAVFERAGWPVETTRAPYPLKAGMFLLAGDETPPQFVDTVSDAFEAGGLEVQYLTGYRDFYKGRQAENPNWVGPTLADDQPFTIVIGARPAS